MQKLTHSSPSATWRRPYILQALYPALVVNPIRNPHQSPKDLLATSLTVAHSTALMMFNPTSTMNILPRRTPFQKLMRTNDSTFTHASRSSLERPKNIKWPTERPAHFKCKLVTSNVPSCLSLHRSPSISSISPASTSAPFYLPRRLQISFTSQSSLPLVALRRPPWKKTLSPHFWFNPTLDGGVFYIDNDTPVEWLRSLSEHVLTLVMKSHRLA